VRNADASGCERFLCVSGKTENVVAYRRCDDYLKCQSRVSTAEDDTIMRAPSEEHCHL